MCQMNLRLEIYKLCLQALKPATHIIGGKAILIATLPAGDAVFYRVPYLAPPKQFGQVSGCDLSDFPEPGEFKRRVSRQF